METETRPLLVNNLIAMHEFPSMYSEGHWDILIGTMHMLFAKFPEMQEYLNTHDIDKNDQKYFIHKIDDLMLISRGKLA